MKNKIRVAYVYFVNLADRAANVSQTLNMLGAFKEQPVEIEFISTWISRRKMNETLKWFIIPDRIEQFRIPIIVHQQNRILEFFEMGAYCLGVWIKLQISKYDVIYTRDFAFLYFLSLISPALRPKVQIIFEAHKIYHRVSKKVNLEQERRALAIPDHIITISQRIKKDLELSLKIDQERMSVHPNGINPEHFVNIRLQKDLITKIYPQTKGKKIILYSGSFMSWKGVDILVEAIKWVQDQECLFLLVGAMGKDKLRISDLARKEKVEGKLIIEEPMSNEHLYSLFSGATLAVIPNIDYLESKYSSPLKVFEYLGAGLPIVASDLGSIREILTERENCLFFKPGEKNDLAGQIDQLLQNLELRTRMSQNNSLLAQDHSWQKRAASLSRKFLPGHGS